MYDVMIDLETLGLRQDAAFVSVGACMFDPDTGRIGEIFYNVVDWDDALCTRTVSGSTLKWWMQRSEAAKKAIAVEGRPVSAVLRSLTSWFKLSNGVRVWSNGATFDISMLENAYAGDEPWQFWNVRDVRTICDLASHLVSKKDIQLEGTQHNALDDAIHQATYVSKMWQALKSE